MDQGRAMIIFNPSTYKKIAIYLYNGESFFWENGSYIPFLNISDKSVAVWTPSYDYFQSVTAQSIESEAGEESGGSNYIFGLCDSFNINGIQYYKPVQTFTYGSFITQPQNNVLKTAGTIVVPIVLPYSVNEIFSPFLEAIWRISVYQFVPFMFYTDIYPVNIGGPLFMSSFNISVDKETPVNITMSFSGGTKIRPPAPGTIDAGNFPFPEDYDPLSVTDEFTPVYRLAKVYDCLFDFPIPTPATQVGIYTSYQARTQWYSSLGRLHIKSMSLKIEQELDEKFTGNDGINKNISDGMKYIAMKQRTVTGSVVFENSSDLLYAYKNPDERIQELVMYFGGPFYYPMKNVSINLFSVEAHADGTYTHQMEFTASIQPQVKAKKKGGVNNPSPQTPIPYYKMNHFDISYEGLFEPIEGNIYVKPQPKI